VLRQEMWSHPAQAPDAKPTPVLRAPAGRSQNLHAPGGGAGRATAGSASSCQRPPRTWAFGAVQKRSASFSIVDQVNQALVTGVPYCLYQTAPLLPLVAGYSDSGSQRLFVERMGEVQMGGDLGAACVERAAPRHDLRRRASLQPTGLRVQGYRGDTVQGELFGRKAAHAAALGESNIC
jgi:hypothetical protein